MVQYQWPKIYYTAIAHLLIRHNDQIWGHGWGWKLLSILRVNIYKKARQCRFAYCRETRHSASLMAVCCTLDWQTEWKYIRRAIWGFVWSKYPPYLSYFLLFSSINLKFQKSWPTHLLSTTGKEISTTATFLLWKQMVWPWNMVKKIEYLQGIRILCNGFKIFEKLSRKKKV